MLAKLRTFSLLGIEAAAVEVEVDVSPASMPKTVLVGLPEAAVKESTHRVERALVNSGFLRPIDRTVINLAPAELPKQAASFDLPISIGMLIASGQLRSELLDKYAMVGELALDGQTRPTKGALSIAMAAARQEGLVGLLVPAASAAEAAMVEDIDVIAVDSLTQAVAFLSGAVEIEPTPARIEDYFQKFARYEVDFADVRGQETAKRAVTVAAAGNHNLLRLSMIHPGTDVMHLRSRSTPTRAESCQPAPRRRFLQENTAVTAIPKAIAHVTAVARGSQGSGQTGSGPDVPRQHFSRGSGFGSLAASRSLST